MMPTIRSARITQRRIFAGVAGWDEAAWAGVACIGLNITHRTPDVRVQYTLTMRLRVLGIVLAGGKGTRLYPLTKERAKPAVPFRGKYPLVAFVLSHFITSRIS